MKKFVIALFLAIFLSAGTYFWQTNEQIVDTASCDANLPKCTDVVTEDRGFPFSFIEQSDKKVGDTIQAQTEVKAPALIINFFSWYVLALAVLVFLDWLGSFVSKIIIRVVIGVAVAAYFLFINLG